MNPLAWKASTFAIVGLVVALAIAIGFARHTGGQRDDLRVAISRAAHVVDARGMPETLSVSGAVRQAAILGAALDAAERIQRDIAVRDSRAIAAGAIANTQLNDEVANDVQEQLDATRDALDAARALAGERLRALRAAEADQRQPGDTAIPYDPEPACRTYGGASCDGLLARLAEAERNTAALIGWQKWFPAMRANYEAQVKAMQARR